MIPSSYCPTCKTRLDACMGVDHKEKPQPQPGDVTICVHCKEVLQFTNTLNVELATAEAIEECGLLQLSRGQRIARLFNLDD